MSETRAGWASAPSRVERPADLAGISEVVRAAHADRTPILPQGAGLSLSAGGRPGATRILLDLTGLSQIVRVVPEDLTATVQAGVPLARACGVADLVLGLLCLGGWRPHLVLGSMLAMLAAYTIGIGVLWPQHWLDPFGGLAKNLPLAGALLVLLATAARR